MILFATIISRLFEPFVMFSVATLLIAMNSGLSPQLLQTFVFVLIFMIGLPIVLLTWAIRMKKIDNWDVSRREQRIVPLIFLIFLTWIYIGVVRHFGNSILINVFVLYIFWLLGFFFITVKWKISGHTSANALATGLLVHWFGWGWWPLLLLVPVVAWARVVRRDHTLAQVIVGALYSWVLVLLFRWWLQ